MAERHDEERRSLRSIWARLKRPIAHTPGDDRVYGEAVDGLLRQLRAYVKDGVDEKTREFWRELMEFLPAYQHHHQGFPDLEELIKFIGHKVENPERPLDAPLRLHVPTSAILGPQKI